MIHRAFIILSSSVFVLIVFATLCPIDARPLIAEPHVERFAAFALMGLLFDLAHPKRTLVVVAVIAGSAIGLEVLQLITPDRHFRLLDAFVKFVGGICGIGIGWLVPPLLQAIKSRPPEIADGN